MNRRSCFKALTAVAASVPASAQSRQPIVLFVDLEVNPAKESELLANYKSIFRPTISKQEGFVSVRLLKLREEIAGKAPAGSPYRLELSFKTEEQRQKWVATNDHQRAWPEIEKCLQGQKHIVLLYDPV